MAHNAMVRVAEDVFVNFYEVASIESGPDEDDTTVVLKSGHKIALVSTTPAQVAKRIAAHCGGVSGYRKTDDDVPFGTRFGQED